MAALPTFDLLTPFDLLTCESHFFAWTHLGCGFRSALDVECTSYGWQAVLRKVGMGASSNKSPSRRTTAQWSSAPSEPPRWGCVHGEGKVPAGLSERGDPSCCQEPGGVGGRMNYSDLWRSLSWALLLETDTDLCVGLMIFLRLGGGSVTKPELQRVNLMWRISMNFWKDRMESPSKAMWSTPKTDLASLLGCFTTKWPCA